MARDDDEALAHEREWQRIVENFGERAVLGPEDEASAAPRREPSDGVGDGAVADAPGTGDDEPADQVPPDERFVPPTPPPVPRPPTDRLLAWLGVFGVPTLVLVCVVLGIAIPSWAGLLLATAFVGGFLYLVVRLPGSPRDPWDDGAVL